jgi:hypothetical protein
MLCFHLYRVFSIIVFQLKFSVQLIHEWDFDSVLDVDLRSWGIVMALPFAVAHKLAALWQHLTLPDASVRLHPQFHVQPQQEPSVEKGSQLGGVLQMESVVPMVSVHSHYGMKLTSWFLVPTLQLHLVSPPRPHICNVFLN